MLAERLEFDPARDSEIFASVGAVPAVFALRGEAGAEPYVGKTTNLRRRLLRLLGPPEQATRRLNLRDRVRSIEYALTGSDFESGLLLYRVLRNEFPKTYTKRLRLRPAPLLRLILENEYPRLTVTTRIATLRGRSLYYGPFPTRAVAEKFANDALDFFLMRRCTDDLHPDPAFPGCIYSEMKMCLAPCFRGCTDAEYHDEVERVQAFLDSRGQSLVRQWSGEREQASAALKFEEAAAIHQRLEELAPVVQPLPEIVRRLDRLDGLIVQPSAEREAVTLFRIEQGRLNGPVQFPVQASAVAEASAAKGKPLSMEARITQALAAWPLLPPGSALETMEELAYLKRWYYRSSKVGEVFFTEANGELPLRRVVRGVSRVFRGEKPAGELSETAGEYWVNRGREAERK